MSTTYFTRGGTVTTTLELICSSSSPLAGWPQPKIVSFATVNILLSVTAFLGNSVILVALHKESSLHRPSKLLYRCLATTDLLVGLVCQPLHATLFISWLHKHRSLCQYAFIADILTTIALGLVSLLTMAAISVDRLLALLLGLRYKQIVTLKRTVLRMITFGLFHFNSTLNPFLYCWKISEVRQVVKQTIRHPPCCPWS
ncbi:adenosine receptor A2b-like [Stylophora pistillata]|uniref:adenosine receptor A2b-like n=1 Tax=Stylophora pistillata TaxID=50429 RepID=UPI000C04900B|nr:adenosine receptor A2b-like [Stylophora pistillata]